MVASSGRSPMVLQQEESHTQAEHTTHSHFYYALRIVTAQLGGSCNLRYSEPLVVPKGLEAVKNPSGGLRGIGASGDRGRGRGLLPGCRYKQPLQTCMFKLHRRMQVDIHFRKQTVKSRPGLRRTLVTSAACWLSLHCSKVPFVVNTYHF